MLAFGEGVLRFRLVALCFFASGAAALLYEVVWARLLGLVFGHTVHAATTVLATYMAGLALGSALMGRRADRLRRPLRTYAALEAAVGLLCLATPALLGAIQTAGSMPARFAWSALVLLPPTVLMGATLPVLSRAAAAEPRWAASRVAALYALNTWGAVAGTLLAGFALLPSIGLRATVLAGVATNVAVAALALWLDRPLPQLESVQPGQAEAGRSWPPIALVAIGVSGAASMGYEIAWTRALSLVLGSSTYAFTAMLSTFLIGLAAGALAVARLARRGAPTLAAFGALEVAIAFSVALLLPAFGLVPEALLFVLRRTGVSYAAALGAQFGFSFLLLIGPSALIGATLPLLVAAIGRAGRLGRDVGTVYAANTAGTIAGSIAAGFLLVPAIGIRGTILAAAAANLLAGLAVLAAKWRRSLAIAGAFAAVAIAVPRWDPKLMTSGVPVYARTFVGGTGEGLRSLQKRRELLLYAEGISTTVAVVRSPTQRSLSVNGKTDAGTGKDMGTQLLLGHLGALLHPHPRRALVIGLASGITAGALAQHPLEAIDVAELEPAMRAASRFFRAENRDVLADPRVTVIDGDGRQVVASARKEYDLIVSEPSNPWIAGVASLFTREFYESARAHLAPDGVMVQWLQAYDIFPGDLRMVVRTFAAVFPHASVWMGSPGDLLLVATPERVRLDWSVVERRLSASAGLREDFARWRWNDGALAYRFLLDEDDARRFAEGALLNTDDLPLLEFSAPRAMYAGSMQENLALLRSFQRVDRPATPGIDAALIEGPRGRLAAAEIAWAEGRFEDAEAEASRVGHGAPGRGRMSFLLGRFAEAWHECAADPEARRYANALAALQREPRRLAGALRAATGYPDPARFGGLLLNLGLAGADADLFAVALEQLRAAADAQPASVPVLNDLAVAQTVTGDPAAGLGTLRRALQIDPDVARTRVNSGAVLERLGRVAEAIEEYREAVRLDPALEQPQRRLAALER